MNTTDNIIKEAKALKQGDFSTFHTGRLIYRPAGALYEVTLCHYTFSFHYKAHYAVCKNFFANGSFQEIGGDKHYIEMYNKQEQNKTDKIQSFDNVNDFIKTLKKLSK